MFKVFSKRGNVEKIMNAPAEVTIIRAAREV